MYIPKKKYRTVRDLFDIQTELKKLPTSPGVYLMKDESETVIYVGKAKILRNRVRSYFQPANANQWKLETMVPLIRSFEYIVTDTEVEALILECTLIKKHWPRFNVLLKDDKTYPYIKVTLADEFPRVFMTREFVKDGSRYFGPYTSGFAVSEVINLIRELWKFRLCTRTVAKDGNNFRPCLNSHIGLCCSPCDKSVSYEDYMRMIDEALDFLDGNHGAILKKLETEMYAFSDDLEYEKAQGVKNKIYAIKKLEEKQRLDNLSEENQDYTAVARENDDALVQVFVMRGGKITGREHFMLSGVGSLTVSEILTDFIKQHYSGTPFIPKEIYVETEIGDGEIITEWLSRERGSKVSLIVPKRGEKLKLVQLASKNAHIQLSQFGEQLKREKQRTVGAAAEIASALGIDSELKRFEIYDISNIQGYESVASMVVFEGGIPKRNDYRKFRLKTVVGADDYASMEEVIRRRFEHYFKDVEEAEKAETDEERAAIIKKAKFARLPDIVCLDGGRGQVNVTERVLDTLGLSIPCCGLVKDDDHRTRGLIYKNKEISLPRTSEGFKLITRMQDEVHRFAIEYHRKLREKKLVKSALDDIKGIGPARKKELFKFFGSVDKIRYATVEELCEAPKMNAKAAKEVYDFFRKN